MSLIDTLKQAGFTGDGLRSAWAIAMRESGGRADAFNGNTNTGDRSWGIFQINTLGSLQGRIKQYGLHSERDLLNPAINAKVAYQMSKGGTDFGAWAIGPNAYKGAPSDAVAKYEKWLGMFPGDNGKKPNPSDPQAAQAYAAGPAAVVNGPSPQQRMRAAQTQSAILLSAANDIVQGKANVPQMVADIKGVREELRMASVASAQSALGAAQYDGSVQDPGVDPNAKAGPKIMQAINIAKAQIGKPYVWGAESPAEGGFDCSGLIDYAFKQAGIKIPGRLTTSSAMRLG